MVYKMLATYDRGQNLGGEVSKVEKADKLGGVRCNAHWGNRAYRKVLGGLSRVHCLMSRAGTLCARSP